MTRRKSIFFSIGLLAIEMMRQREAYFEGTDYIFMQEIPWVYLAAINFVVRHVVNYTATWSLDDLGRFSAKAPRFIRIVRGHLYAVITLLLLKDGIKLLEKLQVFLECPGTPTTIFDDLNKAIEATALNREVRASYGLGRPYQVYRRVMLYHQVMEMDHELSTSEEEMAARDVAKASIGTIRDLLNMADTLA
jgi:hypothetical protein